MDPGVVAPGILGPCEDCIVTTLNSKKTPVLFNPDLHARGTVQVTNRKGQQITLPGIVKDLQTLKLRRRLDNPHTVEWTLA